MNKIVFFDLMNDLLKHKNNITPKKLLTILLDWLNRHPKIVGEFINNHSDIRDFLTIENINEYPIEYKKMEENELARLINHLMEYINNKSDYTYQFIEKILNDLLLIQSDMECPICFGEYGFDIWIEEGSKKPVFCCKTCGNSFYFDMSKRKNKNKLLVPTTSELRIHKIINDNNI